MSMVLMLGVDQPLADRVLRPEVLDVRPGGALAIVLAGTLDGFLDDARVRGEDLLVGLA
ncbi:MAG: hypothetical protein ACOC26_01325 [Halochromatium sp.]